MSRPVAILALLAAILSAAYSHSYSNCSACSSSSGAESCSSDFTCQNNQCVHLQPFEENCEDPCSRCQEPYVCKWNICRIPDLKCGQSCSFGASGSVCETGLYCHWETKKCIENSRSFLNQACSDCKICESDDLTCSEGKCITFVPPVVLCGDPCSMDGRTQCEIGSSCINAKCTKYVGPGQSCGSCGTCWQNFECVNDSCVAESTTPPVVVAQTISIPIFSSSSLNGGKSQTNGETETQEDVLKFLGQNLENADEAFESSKGKDIIEIEDITQVTGANQTDVEYLLRLHTLRLKELTKMEKEAVQIQVLEQIRAIFQHTAQHEGWSESKLASSIAEYSVRTNDADERDLARRTIEASRINTYMKVSLEKCRFLDLEKVERDHRLAKDEYWPDSLVNFYKWLADRRVEKCADSLAHIRNSVVTIVKPELIQKLEQEALAKHWSDETYIKSLKFLAATFETSHKSDIDQKVQSLYQNRIAMETIALKEQAIETNISNYKRIWRLAANKVRDDIVRAIQKDSISRNWTEIETKSRLNTEMSSFKANYSAEVSAAYTSIEYSLQAQKRSILEAYKEDLKLTIAVEKTVIMGGITSEGPIESFREVNVTNGLAQRYSREVKKMTETAKMAGLNPTALFNALEKERLIHNRYSWLKLEIRRLNTQTEIELEADIDTKIGNIKSNAKSFAERIGKTIEAWQILHRQMKEMENIHFEAEIAFLRLPVSSDPLSGTKERSAALKIEIKKASRARAYLRKANLEAPYRWGQRRLHPDYRAKNSSLEQAEMNVTAYIIEADQATLGSLPQIDPVFLGVDKNKLNETIAHKTIEDALLDMSFVHHRQSKLETGTREKLAAYSSQASAKLIGPTKDAKDWWLFSRALETLALKNRCGAVYNNKQSSFGICCLFQVQNITTAYSFCSKPSMMGLPEPSDQTIPELGLQWGMPEMMHALPKNMQFFIARKLESWKSPELDEVINILKQQSKLRREVLISFQNLDAETNKLIYQDFIENGGYSMQPEQITTYTESRMTTILMKAGKKKEETILRLFLEYNNFDIQDDLQVFWDETHKTLSLNLEKISLCSIGLAKDSVALAKTGGNSMLLQQLIRRQNYCETVLLSVLDEYRESFAHILKLFESMQSNSSSSSLESNMLLNSTSLTSVQSVSAQNVSTQSVLVQNADTRNSSFNFTNRLFIASGSSSEEMWSYETSSAFLSYFAEHSVEPVYIASATKSESESAATNPSAEIAANSCLDYREEGHCNILCCDAIQMYSPRCKTLLGYCF